MREIVQVFKALGDETRLKILIMLSKRRICAKGIAKHLGISEAAVSQHIKVLKEVGLIEGEKISYFVHYNVQNSKLLELIRFIEEINSSNNIDQFYNSQLFKKCRANCKSKKNLCCYNNKK